ncbi:hypothetical protein POVWA2_045900 [Plasmodium ovale wallikeri]|uniref:Uncharacterized protein n=1 Tax=Plasmodium ovale wallikeri TaxID=864142 RepID=A0A1A8ZHQ2_PLAOA|nr:hypothetical protein POVWA1_047020 [Plasmodium ovale wallikeri]SBT43406.1 hypothetical protein POVWA2_045900 [Plasmodium ovale wallikeri]
MLMVWDTSKNSPYSAKRGLWQKRRSCRACVNVQIVLSAQKVEVVQNAQYVEVVQMTPDISNTEKKMSPKYLMEQARCKKALNEPDA